VPVEEAVIPANVNDADAADFIESVRIHDLVESLIYGHNDLVMSPAEVLPYWQVAASPRRLFVLRVDGVMVARAMYEWLLEDPDTAWVHVDVLPEHRHRGNGTQLAEALESAARTDGRTKLIGYAVSGEAPGERLASPTGFGSMPLDNAEVQFALGRGFRLEQVVRGSRLPLPADVDVPTPDPDYRLHEWAERVPDEWLDDMAIMLTRMSTDAPSAGLEEPEDVHTPERIRAEEQAEAQSPRTSLTVAVEHVPTGRLAGFTILSVPREVDRPVHQDDTLVLREHRGKRLGMLLKAANLDYLQRQSPGHPLVVTFNAEENRFMLDINEQLGFVPMGYEGAWRLELA
jgi:GNAT superfamily N-acetyltransferase